MDDRARSPLGAGLVLAFYGAMTLVAWLLAWFFHLPSLWHRTPTWPHLLTGPLGLALGAVVGLLTHGLGRWAATRFGWARRFYERLGELLGPVSGPQAVVAAAASGLGEELLFRGALLPLLGLFWQAVVFGLLHFAPGREFRFWPFYAFGMALVLGLLYQGTGMLLAPVLAHFTVNYFGLATLVRRR